MLQHFFLDGSKSFYSISALFWTDLLATLRQFASFVVSQYFLMIFPDTTFLIIFFCLFCPLLGALITSCISLTIAWWNSNCFLMIGGVFHGDNPAFLKTAAVFLFNVRELCEDKSVGAWLSQSLSSTWRDAVWAYFLFPSCAAAFFFFLYISALHHLNFTSKWDFANSLCTFVSDAFFFWLCAFCVDSPKAEICGSTIVGSSDISCATDSTFLIVFSFVYTFPEQLSTFDPFIPSWASDAVSSFSKISPCLWPALANLGHLWFSSIFCAAFLPYESHV